MALPPPHGSDEFPPFSEAFMTPRERRAVLFREVDLLIDGGANRGQYAAWARHCGFDGRIVSFEPSSREFAALAEAAAADDAWECQHAALGAADGETVLHLSRSTLGSSVFVPTDEHHRAWPDDVSDGDERVRVRSLPSLWPEVGGDGSRVYLKLDVEGSELAVLEGAGDLLDRVTLLELEMCLVPLYRDAPLFAEVLAFLDGRGFSIVALEQNGGDDRSTGRMLMLDAVFRGPDSPWDSALRL